MMDTVLVISLVTLMCFFVWHIFALVGEMAKDRGHNPWPWLLLSLAWSPFATIVILWAFFDLKEVPSQAPER
ncbi:hypothetical protein [Phaeovulum sp. NW3]|uniref:hypothetical protein n=1 Tax=Phaeovulum sp. NW3 TaxID=2934933 RepID=UPI0020201370|nr:hypothetical protein [Phaeovulum sp. NW3]MCL7466263.1 hypothetical protein [Phaeovulum sp. NW3]